MAKLNLYEWGHENVLKTPYLTNPNFKLARTLPAGTVFHSRFEGSTLELPNEWKFSYHGLVFQKHAIISRGTCVLSATVNDHPCQSNGFGTVQCKEGSLVVVKLSWTPESRRAESEVLQRAYDTDDYASFHNHLPKVVDALKIVRPNICDRLGVLLGDKYEKLTLRVLIQQQLFPITELHTAPDLVKAFVEIFKCQLSLHVLYKFADSVLTRLQVAL